MTAERMYEMVHRFNRDLVGVPIPTRPTVLGFERGEFRLGHMREELSEIQAALAEEDLAGAADGLLDLIYVAMGALVEMGVAPGAAFEEVHRANMAKTRGENAKRPGGLGHDAVKPEGWTPPDLEPYLTITRAELLHAMTERALLGLPGAERQAEQGRVHLNIETPDADSFRRDHCGPYTPKAMRRPAPRLLIIGHARHGKDTVCELLRERYGLRFTSSSKFCAERVVWPLVLQRATAEAQDMRERYANADECFQGRGNHRSFWYEAIRDFNAVDPTSLARYILEENDVYCGMRSKAELHACRNTGLFDHIIWVDASDRVQPEDASSCTVEPWMADFVVDNNGNLGELQRNVRQLMRTLAP